MTNFDEVRRGIAGALETARSQGLAATRVDAFGHSMGGLLLRMHQSGSFNMSPHGLDPSGLRSLVTVDTPHAGSPLADILHATPSVHPLFARLNWHADRGAIEDLQTTSPVLASLEEAVVPAHAFVGKGASDLIELGLVASAPRKVQAMLLVLEFFGILPEDIFPPGLQHDIAVGRLSQEGGLGTGSSQTSVFGFVSVIPRNLGLHIFSVTLESQVGDRAIEILNSDIADATTFAPSFPAASPSPSRAPFESVSRGMTSGEISIVSPLDGASVTPGTTLQVTVAATGAFAPTEVLVVADDDAGTIDTGPFTVDIEIPLDAAGEMTIEAVARDAQGELASAVPVRVNVVVPATLTGISTRPSRVQMFHPADDQQLTVVGHYDDGVDRDLSADTFGTLYTTADRRVVTVDPDGKLTANSVGVTWVEVTTGGFTATTVVQVEPLTVLLEVAPDGLRWPAMRDAIGYDVVRGDLSLLIGTLGSYELGIAECLADDWPGTTLVHTVDPLPGDSHFYLVRSVTGTGPRSYDAEAFGATAQSGLRDAGIAGAVGACP